MLGKQVESLIPQIHLDKKITSVIVTLCMLVSWFHFFHGHRHSHDAPAHPAQEPFEWGKVSFTFAHRSHRVLVGWDTF